MSTEVAVALARIEAKLDSSLAQGADHESRLRVVETRSTVTLRQLAAAAVTAVGVGAAVFPLLAHSGG